MKELIGKPLDGAWWAPDRPDIVYKGILQIEEDHTGRLTLRGSELHLSSLPIGPRPTCFFGRLIAHYTYEVTLLRVGVERGPAPRSVPDPNCQTEAVFYTNVILVAGHVPSEDEQFIPGALLNVTGLEEWCDATGFSWVQRPNLAGYAAKMVCVSFQDSASPYYELGDGHRLRLLSQFKGPYSFEGRKQVNLTKSNTIELSFPEYLSINQLMNEIHIWQTFITFGLRRASYFDEIMLVFEDQPRMALLVPG